jgi:hypothetical protein
MTGLTMAEQVGRMRERFPALRHTEHCRWWATWTGPVRPAHRAYTISIQYVRRYWLGELEVTNGYLPEVTLLDPTLKLEHPSTGQLVPHVYWRDDRPERSTLCVYDPAADEWSPDDFIADTIVPWACDWLACYEGWLAIGEWTGGGRHPRRRSKDSCQVARVQNRDLPDRAQRAAFHSLGMKIGTFASLPLMVAASEGSFRPLSWRDWRNDTWAANRLPDILISSPAPPRVASSPLDWRPGLPPEISASFTSSAATRFSLPMGRDSSDGWAAS